MLFGHACAAAMRPLLEWTRFPHATMAVDVRPCARHSVLVLNVKCQYMFFVSIVVWPKQVWVCKPQVLHEVLHLLGAVVPHRLSRFLKHDVVAVQFDRDLMIPDANAPFFARPSSDIESINLHVVQAVDVVLDRKNAICTINGFRLGVIAARERKTNGAHEHIGFPASGHTGNQNQSESTGGDDTHGEIPPARCEHYIMPANGVAMGTEI